VILLVGKVSADTVASPLHELGMWYGTSLELAI
jgi:hypothetical protein